MSEYSVEEVRACLAEFSADVAFPREEIDIEKVRAMLIAYAERIKADEGAVPSLWIEFTDDGQNIRLWTRNEQQAAEEIREGRKLLAFYARPLAQGLNEQSGISGQLEFLKGILEGLSMAKSECDNRVFALDGGDNQFRREATASQCAEAIRLVYARMFREMTAMPTAHPPAQPAQLWEMKQRACRAHALCNELRLAHPEIPELGDDGVLHEAIHDILRVDTPTAAPAQAAQDEAPPGVPACCCGRTGMLGVVHRIDGPCFHYVEPTAERVVEGWVLVPREPSDAMFEAALILQGEDAALARSPALLSALLKTYRAMLAAAPQPGESA